MPKFAYVGVTLQGAPTRGIHRAASRSDAEVALYGRDLRDLRVTEKKSLLQYELSGPRIKREEVMHLSRQIAAFLRAGLPIRIGAVPVMAYHPARAEHAAEVHRVHTGTARAVVRRDQVRARIAGTQREVAGLRTVGRLGGDHSQFTIRLDRVRGDRALGELVDRVQHVRAAAGHGRVSAGAGRTRAGGTRIGDHV